MKKLLIFLVLIAFLLVSPVSAYNLTSEDEPFIGIWEIKATTQVNIWGHNHTVVCGYGQMVLLDNNYGWWSTHSLNPLHPLPVDDFGFWWSPCYPEYDELTQSFRSPYSIGQPCYGNMKFYYQENVDAIFGTIYGFHTYNEERDLYIGKPITLIGKRITYEESNYEIKNYIDECY